MIHKTRQILFTAWCLLAALSIPLMGAEGCAHQQQASLDDGKDLQSALRNFHKNLRWARYEQASYHISEAYQPTFMGRYEEYGEDYHMVKLEVVRVDMNPIELGETPTATVKVEQEWYREPNMTVKDEVYVESWRRERDGWKLTDRVTQEEWREAEKAKKREAAAAKEAKEADASSSE